MKKIVITALILSIAVATQASTVVWNSGAVYTPNTDGSLSTSKLTSSAGMTLTMIAWESSSSFSSYSSGDLYKWYTSTDQSNDPFGGNLTQINGSITMNASGSKGVATGILNPGDDGQTVYGAVLFVLSDDTGNKWYMENVGSVQTSKSVKTLSNLANKVGGSGAATSWTAVPEPTSGLLMLLGIAGLALKRKKA